MTPLEFANFEGIGAMVLGAVPMLGGVRYEVESVRPHHRLTLAIEHSEESRFTVFLSIEERLQGGSYTRFAVRTDFRELDEIVLRCILAHRRESAPLSAIDVCFQ